MVCQSINESQKTVKKAKDEGPSPIGEAAPFISIRPEPLRGKEYLTIKSGPTRRMPAEQDSPGTEIPAAASIDDPRQVQELLEKMEYHLPISAEIKRPVARRLSRQGINIPPHRQVIIDKIFYHGVDGGIACSIQSPGGKEAIVISLTHLKVRYGHPIIKEIRAYQRERIRKIQ